MQVITENLSYTYSEKSKSLAVKALKNISLTIEEGDFFGIIGRTGSGKSTFIQHINGLIKINKNCGKIVVGEFDLTDKKCDFLKLRSKVGMVMQYPEYQLFAETVYEDVSFGLKNFFPEMKENEISEKVKHALELVGLDYERVKDKSPFDFSGGLKRRIAIAGVIVSRPEVLVLDEPLAGLDPQGKKEFISLLQTLHRDFVKTIIIISHDMDMVAEYCNKVAVFNDGEIYKTGTPQQVFTEDIAEIGLDLPLIAKLKNALNKKGYNLKGELSADSFVDEFIKAYKGGKR